MIQVTDIARKRIDTLVKDQATQFQKKIKGVRLTTKGILPNVEYALSFVEEGKEEAGDVSVDAAGIQIYMESKNASFLEDVKVDFINNLDKTGFKVDNPKVVMPETTLPDTPANLTSPEAKAVQKVLDEEINPAIASHGGMISLVDVKENIAYIQLGGGCQGCGMADVTLKQGVVVAIKKAIPEIQEVLDVTDHAGGENPYFTPGK
ncbi:MAG: NifU family protein [Nitrospira sp.]|nr:iron-sulfur cluster assembly accessory protein [Candidatus Manganitrophaceae bacterium]HIL35311.1 iron-sulfur cluster assembly accessory protein [Candidatus Manganitrophaceae bacterium]